MSTRPLHNLAGMREREFVDKVFHILPCLDNVDVEFLGPAYHLYYRRSIQGRQLFSGPETSPYSNPIDSSYIMPCQLNSSKSTHHLL